MNVQIDPAQFWRNQNIKLRTIWTFIDKQDNYKITLNFALLRSPENNNMESQ